MCVYRWDREKKWDTNWFWSVMLKIDQKLNGGNNEDLLWKMFIGRGRMPFYFQTNVERSNPSRKIKISLNIRASAHRCVSFYCKFVLIFLFHVFSSASSNWCTNRYNLSKFVIRWKPWNERVPKEWVATLQFYYEDASVLNRIEWGFVSTYLININGQQFEVLEEFLGALMRVDSGSWIAAA